MKRHQALEIILKNLSKNDLAVFTTGMISREAFAAKDRGENFYMLGSMGLVSPLALGIALNEPKRKVIAVEGDGSMLLNLGSMPMVAAENPSNFLHLVLDNESYESTGSQPSISGQIDLAKLATAAGYRNVKKVRTLQNLRMAFERLLKSKGPNFLLVKVESSHLEGVPRVSHAPEEIKERFMGRLRK